MWSEARQLILIGASAGAPRSHHVYLAGDPAPLSAPVVIVQHMPRGPFILGMLRYLQKAQPRPASLVRNGETLAPDRVYLVSPGSHLTFRGPRRAIVRPTGRENEFAPSMDVAFASAAGTHGAGVRVGLVSGLHADIDGLAGCQSVRQAGGRVIATTRATTEVYSMIEQVAAQGQVDAYAPLPRLLAALRESLEDGR